MTQKRLSRLLVKDYYGVAEPDKDVLHIMQSRLTDLAGYSKEVISAVQAIRINRLDKAYVKSLMSEK